MKKIRAVLAGGGMRGTGYAKYALDHPDELELVAVAEPNKERRDHLKKLHNLPDSRCFESFTELFSLPKMAELAMICTQDNMHVGPALAAIDKGYEILLEKPVAPTAKECRKVEAAAIQKGVHVVVCHVLRYSAFFANIKEMIDSGAIGEVVSIVHNENVGYFHQAHSFVRGNWRNTAQSSPMILAKSCHDMDLLQWLLGKPCKKVHSFGALCYFTRENCPPGAPARCIEGCPHAKTCPYDTKKLYENGLWWFQEAAANKPSPTPDEVRAALRTGPYGRCVFQCDNDVVDHQVVNLEFEGGVTAAFSMCAFTPETTRTIKIMGTKGQIRGLLADKMEIVADYFETNTQAVIDPQEKIGGIAGHGGGDTGLMASVCAMLRGQYAGNAISDISTSVHNHNIAFAAEASRLENRVVQLSEFENGGKTAGL